MSLFNVIVEQYVSESFLSSSSLKVQLTPLLLSLLDREKISDRNLVLQSLKKVKSITTLSQKHKHITQQRIVALHRRTRSLRTAQNKQQCTRCSHGDTQYFLASNRFLQENGCQNHSYQRHTGSDDGSIHGRSHSHPENVASLIENNGQQRSHEKFHQIFMPHVFGFLEKRKDPKQNHCAEYAQISHHQGADCSSYHHKLGQRSHQSPHAVSGQHRHVTFHFCSVHKQNISFSGAKLREK